jgi:hypothetical protein
MLLADYNCAGVCLADMNGDGLTNTADVLLFLAVYGSSCP